MSIIQVSNKTHQTTFGQLIQMEPNQIVRASRFSHDGCNENRSRSGPVFLTDLDRYVLVLAGRLGGEHVRDLGVRRGLPTNGTFDGSPP